MSVPVAAFDDVTLLLGQWAVFAWGSWDSQVDRVGLTPAFRGPMSDRLWAAKRAILSLEVRGVDPGRLGALARVALWAEQGGAPPCDDDLDVAEPLIVGLVSDYRPQGRPSTGRPDMLRWDAMVPDVARTWLEALDGL